MAQANEIFTIAGDCATTVYIKNKVNNNNRNNNNNNNNIVRYSAAGYILICMVAPPYTTNYGYVLSRNAATRQLTVHLATNNVIIVPEPFYNRPMNTFDFLPFIYDGQAHEVKEYTPIYILLSSKGHMSFVMHRFGCTQNLITNEITIQTRLCG